MARSRASIFVTVWQDEHWRATPSSAKYLYLLLLSQARVTLAGCIDLMPRRWADMDPDRTEADVLADLDVLQERGYIVVDPESGELLIRSFAKNDVCSGTVNSNTMKGYWSAWESILSPTLRKVAVDNTPEGLWCMETKKGQVTAPAAAQERASEPPLERPFHRLSEQVSEPPLPPPSPSPPPLTSTELVPTSISGDSRAEPDEGTDAPMGTRQERGDAAVRLFGNRQADKALNVPGQVRSDPERYRQSCIDGATAEHGPRAHQLAHEHPTWPPERIADELGRRANPGDDWVSPKAMYEAQDAQRRARQAEAEEAGEATVEEREAALAPLAHLRRGRAAS